MPLGRPIGLEVGLGLGDFLLDGVGDPVPFPKKAVTPAKFSAHSIVDKRVDASRCHLIWRSASAQGTLCVRS